VHLLSLVVAGALLLYLGRTFWFHYDEWDIVGNHTLGLFEPHNEHWSTLPYLVYGALYPVFGLRQYLPYLSVVVVLHLGVAHLAWRLLQREGVGAWLATGISAAFVVLGAGAENLVWAWQMGFVGAVFFGLLALVLAATGQATLARDAGASLACLAAVMCSGIGLVMVFVVAVAIVLRRGWQPALGVVLPAALAFAAWYLTAGRHTGARTYSQPTVGGSLTFLWVGMSATAEMASGLKFLGPVLVVGAAAWAALRMAGSRAGTAVSLACFGGAVALFCLISLGRLQYGADSARQGRYVYVAATLLLPVGGLALQSLSRVKRVGVVAAALLVLWAGVHGGRVLLLAEEQHRVVSQNTRHLVLAAAAQIDPGSAFDPNALPDPVAAPTLTLARVARFKREGALPDR
jgi:hypothetical protein